MTDVLHIITGLGMGGAEAMLVQLTSALQRRGISQHVISLTSYDERAADLRASGIGLTVLDGGAPAMRLNTVWNLVRITNHLKPRIIQGWMYHGNLAASFCHYVCRERRRRRLLWNLRASNMDEKRYGRLLRLSALVSRSVDVVVANSQAGADFHRAYGYRPKRFEVIDNGINTERFRPDAELRKMIRAELGIADDAVVAINIARVDPMKDHAMFLAAMEKVPRLTGIIAGKNTETLQVPPNVRALGIRRNTESLFAGADIVASTSAFGEGFSNVIAEGMSAGLVPVATDVGDAKRIIGDTGAIVAPGDPAAFASALAAVAMLPESERRRRGLEARARIVQHFTLEKAVEAYAALYAAV